MDLVSAELPAKTLVVGIDLGCRDAEDAVLLHPRCDLSGPSAERLDQLTREALEVRVAVGDVVEFEAEAAQEPGPKRGLEDDAGGLAVWVERRAAFRAGEAQPLAVRGRPREEPTSRRREVST